MTGEYTTAQVAELTGVSAARVRRFVALGLLEPSRGPRGEHRFAFPDVALLRAWAKLPGSSPARIRRVVDDCRRRGITEPSLRAEGAAIVARDGSGVWDPGTGQQLLDLTGPAAAVDAVARLPEHALVARALSDARDPRQAEALYRSTLDRDPEDGEAMIELGRVRHEAGDAREAAAWYERAVAVGAVAVTAWFNLGVAREDIGDLDGALGAYRAALLIDPSCADAHYNAARLCERAGDQLGALRHLRAYSSTVSSRPSGPGGPPSRPSGPSD